MRATWPACTVCPRRAGEIRASAVDPLARAIGDRDIATSVVLERLVLQQEVQLALHTYLGGNTKLSAAWYHPMNGEKGGAAASDPKTDQFIVQAQAKF